MRLLVKDLIESDDTGIAGLGLNIGEDSWDDNGAKIPTVHDNLGTKLSRLSIGIPKWRSEDERPDKSAVDDEQDHQKLDISPEHVWGNTKWNNFLQCDEPALLNAHQQHTHLPKHVWNVVKSEVNGCFGITEVSVRRVDKDHVEVHESDELNDGHDGGSTLEAGEFRVGLDHDTVVMQDDEGVGRKSVEHNDQCSGSLGWIEVQHGASVAEVEHFVDESLCLIEVAWCSMEEFILPA